MSFEGLHAPKTSGAPREGKEINWGKEFTDALDQIEKNYPDLAELLAGLSEKDRSELQVALDAAGLPMRALQYIDANQKERVMELIKSNSFKEVVDIVNQ